MRRIMGLLFCGFFAFLPPSLHAEEIPKEQAGIGKKIEDFKLADAQGKEHSLADFSKHKTLVVVFLGTDCPLAKLYAERLSDLAKDYQKKGVGFVGIDANVQDSAEDVVAFTKEHGIKFPVLLDPTGGVADQFLAKRNPEAFVLDTDRVVQYRGRIDDQYGLTERGCFQRTKETRKDLAIALDEVSGKKPVSEPVTEAPGCIIGRKREAKTDGAVTYSKQISRILQSRCVQCHRPGDIGPFALESYDDVIGWGEMIQEVVDDQRMPPWHADPSHGEFTNDARMTDEEKAQIRQWVADGCPEGDKADLPPPKKFPKTWRIGKPDMVVAMSGTPFKVPAQGVLDYKYYTVNPGFKKDVWVKAAECRPGNRAVVHHIIVFVKAPGENEKEVILRSSFLASTAPGGQPMLLPAGLAKKIPAGSQLLFQMHYTTNGTAQTDKSEIGLVFADEKEVQAEVKTDFAGTFTFLIPPQAADHKVTASNTFNKDAMLLQMYPHMHVRGKAFRYEAVYPDGKKEVLLDVPNYDFNWQNTYTLKEPKFLPAGSSIQCTATYDNSAENLNNPDPSQMVHFGDQTWDEMMLGFFDAVPVDQADVRQIGRADQKMLRPRRLWWTKPRQARRPSPPQRRKIPSPPLPTKRARSRKRRVALSHSRSTGLE
ncbi:MAG: redoxin domain-containing protein [Planctomycetota bacterium]